MSLERMENTMGILLAQFETGGYAWLAILGVLVLTVIINFFRAAHGARTRSLESRYYLFFCVTILIWVASNLFFYLFSINETDAWIDALTNAMRSFVLVALVFHVWSQVSYKPITVVAMIRYMIVPLLLVGIAALLYFFPNIDAWTQISQSVAQSGQQPTSGTTPQDTIIAGIQSGRGLLSISYLQDIIFILFRIFTLVRAYLLCLNVFYQMPRHMRRSTHRMLLAISALAITWLLELLISMSSGMNNVLIALAYFVALAAFYSAFFIANSANVIVTSRDFVFASLSTVVITVSRKGSILDWNKKSSDVGMALPRPRYKESYDHYRARLLESCNGVTSPHDDNIITTTINGVERHYLFTHHEIGYKGRIFGRLVEISEVTKSYSVLRYLEEIAMVDNLTGLRNRNAYIDAVKTILVPENMPLGIIVGDVNNLKRTNDVQGHLQGDRLLQSVSAIISDNMPAESSVFRIGGDELVLLIPRATPDVPQKFVNGVTAGCEAATDEIYGTPSISWGCALMTDLSQNYNEVFRAADAMMYENKCASKVVSLSGIVAE